MESIFALLAGALAIATASLFAPKKKRTAAPLAKSAPAQHALEQSEVVIPMAKKKASKAAKHAAASKKQARAAAPAKSRTTKRKVVKTAKAPTSIGKTRKRKAS